MSGMLELPVDMTPSCRMIDLTPRTADRLLENNVRNRSLRRGYVEKLAAAMERGEWIVNGEPIQVACDGTLLNGQHRLHAVRESGVTIRALLVTGLPLDSQRSMDTGTRRTLSDVLALHEETDTVNLAATLGLLYRFRNGHRLNNSGRSAPTPQEALELLQREPAVRSMLSIGRHVHRTTGMRVSVVTVLAYLFEEAAHGTGEAFFVDVCRDIDEQPRRSPARLLRSILERKRRERSYALPTYVLSAMTIKAYNAWVTRASMVILTFRPGGRKPEPFPEIAAGA